MNAYDTRLLWNDEPNHASEILHRLDNADRFVCMVAFAKESGFSLLNESLEAAVKRGMVATFVIGTDFYQSQPSVIDKLLKLRRFGAVHVYMGSTERQYVFHPKLFMFESGEDVHFVVGSANWTGGGLANNHELSVVFGREASGLSPHVDEWISSLISDREIFEATPERVADYARRHAIYNRRMVLAQKQAERAVTDPDGGVGTLAQILAEMRTDKSYYGFDQSVARRAASAVEGLEILKEIAQGKSETAQEFLKQYNRLLVTFHSGGLHRGKSGVTRDRTAFIDGVRSILEFDGQERAAAFDHLLGHFRLVNRAGTNLSTEILHLLDQRRYAVMNQNSVAGLKLAGHLKFPEMPSKQNMTGEIYFEFCEKADGVRAELGLSDFRELDALFNYAYWREEGEE